MKRLIPFLIATSIWSQVVAETPKYLYKILSERHWQATQARKAFILSADDHDFIHFSTKDQLERIQAKYWANVERYAVLTIDSSLLEGNLKYEANPGGSTQYYHLYNGFIPYEAVIKAKMIGPENPQKILPIVKQPDPVLNQTARMLTHEEILSPEIQQLIEDMKATMRAAPGVGLAAPQIGQSIQLAVIEDMDLTHLSADQLAERERTVVPFHVVINPVLYLDNQKRVDFFEGCLSVPELMAIVPRSRTVTVECLNERAEPVIIEANGWYARILQHEIDHLNGKLYLCCAHKKTVMTETDFSKNWKGKTVQEIMNSLL